MNTNPKSAALALHLGVAEDTISECHGDNYESTEEPGEYWVMTDDEANDAWDASLESYIEECILPEVPEQFRNYFDNEAFKRDARHDGRGHSLSSYDGTEHEIKVDGEWYYIYRTN